MTKNTKNKIDPLDKLVCQISYRISDDLYQHLQKYISENETINSFARKMVNPKRIAKTPSYEIEKITIATLMTYKDRIDKFTKVFGGINNNEKYSLSSINRPIVELVNVVSEMSHFLSIIVAENKLNLKKERRPNNIKIIEEDEGKKNNVVIFKVSTRTMNELTSRATGSESIAQLCRAMLDPNAKILPTSTSMLKIKHKERTFFTTRFTLLNRYLYSISNKSPVLNYEMTRAIEIINEVDHLISILLKVDIYERPAKQKQ